MAAAQAQPTLIKPSRWLMQRSKAARRWVMSTIGLAMLSGLLLIAQANILGRIVDRAYIHHQALSALLLLFLLFLGAIVLRALLAYLRELTSFQAGATLRSAIRMEVLQKIAQLGPVYSQRWSSAELSTMVIEQVEALQAFYAKFLPQMTIAVLLPLVIVAFVFPYSWMAGLILLITAPLVPLFMAIIGMGAAALNRRNYQALSRMSATFLDVLQGLPTLKWFGQSKAVATKVFDVSEQYRHTTMGVLRVVFLSSAVLEFFSALAIALLATYLGLTFLRYLHTGYWGHGLTLSGALFILILAPEFYMPLRELNTHYHARAEAVAAAESLTELLYAAPTIPTATTKKTLPVTAQRAGFQITLHDVNVTFPETALPALNGISLEIKPGAKVAVTGPSGAGKSTLANVLMGFVIPDSGSVRVNGVDLQTLDITDWRRQLGWLAQTSRLFYGSIRENLLMFKPDATEKQMWRALQDAEAEQFVKQLPKGLDTMISEQSQGLSGGQAQRIALARLYLQDAPIWILDEPTASLDRDYEQRVFKKLLNLAKNKTVIMVTHKPELAKQFAQVVRLQKGK